MSISTYTTADTIRALLGVSSLEIEDVQINLPNYELTFLLEIEDIDKGAAGLLPQYTTFVAIMPPSSRTAQQQRYIDLFGLLAAYSAARQILTTDSTAMPVLLADGRAQFERVQARDRLVAAISASYNLVRSRLAAAYLVLVPSADIASPESRVYTGAVGLGSDPVLGT